jgi:hypothetical protein
MARGLSTRCAQNDETPEALDTLIRGWPASFAEATFVRTETSRSLHPMPIELGKRRQVVAVALRLASAPGCTKQARPRFGRNAMSRV